jgi:hypothetical protein
LVERIENLSVQRFRHAPSASDRNNKEAFRYSEPKLFFHAVCGDDTTGRIHSVAKEEQSDAGVLKHILTVSGPPAFALGGVGYCKRKRSQDQPIIEYLCTFGFELFEHAIDDVWTHTYAETRDDSKTLTNQAARNRVD